MTIWRGKMMVNSLWGPPKPLDAEVPPLQSAGWTSESGKRLHCLTPSYSSTTSKTMDPPMHPWKAYPGYSKNKALFKNMVKHTDMPKNLKKCSHWKRWKKRRNLNAEASNLGMSYQTNRYDQYVHCVDFRYLKANCEPITKSMTGASPLKCLFRSITCSLHKACILGFVDDGCLMVCASQGPNRTLHPHCNEPACELLRCTSWLQCVGMDPTHQKRRNIVRLSILQT